MDVFLFKIFSSSYRLQTFRVVLIIIFKVVSETFFNTERLMWFVLSWTPQKQGNLFYSCLCTNIQQKYQIAFPIHLQCLSAVAEQNRMIRSRNRYRLLRHALLTCNRLVLEYWLHDDTFHPVTLHLAALIEKSEMCAAPWPFNKVIMNSLISITVIVALSLNRYVDNMDMKCSSLLP